MEVDMSDFFAEISVPIMVVLNSGESTTDEYGVEITTTTTVNTTAYISDKNSISSYKTNSGTYVPASSFEFYLPKSIYEQYIDEFDNGGYFVHNGKKYYIGTVLLYKKEASQAVIEGMFIGADNYA